MTKHIRAFALIFMICLCFALPACAARLGPADSYEALLQLAAQAKEGDVLLVAGEISAEGRILSPDKALRITSEGGRATISGLSLRNASLTFSNINLTNGLRITGDSHVQLASGVSVKGKEGKSGIDFSGSGALLLDPGSAVTGGEAADGVVICHTGGDLYISLDGSILGGAADAGGSAVTIDPLGEYGALMVTGTLTGGQGTTLGGNALNLYNLSGNAYITVDGRLTGGQGTTGGCGLQLITASDSVTAGLRGQITGGQGRSFGGDAMILMNVTGSASIALSGALTGGNTSAADSIPGQSLQILGKNTALHTYLGEVVLQDGRQFSGSTAVTPLPAITSSIDLIRPTPSPSPDDAQTPSVTPTARPEETPEAAPAPEATASPSPSPEATASPSPTPDSSPSPSPSPEHTPVSPEEATPGEAAPANA